MGLQWKWCQNRYLAKEQSHGAILDPVRVFGQHPEHSFVHCSPILTRPVGQNKRRVTLDLSYSKGLVLNGQVDMVRYDGDLFCRPQMILLEKFVATGMTSPSQKLTWKEQFGIFT